MYLTADQLVLIESYNYKSKKIWIVINNLRQSKDAIYNICNVLKDSLRKRVDFNEVGETFIQAIASKRNNIPYLENH